MFEVGQKVVCVDASGYGGLTIGKVYIVDSLWDYGVRVIDDKGELAGMCSGCFKPHTETEAERRGAKFGVTGVVKDKGFRVSFVKERKGFWRVFDENGMDYDFKPSEIRLDHEPEFIAWSEAPEHLRYDASRVYYDGKPVKWIAKPEGAGEGMDAVFVTTDGFIIAGNEYLTVKL